MSMVELVATDAGPLMALAKIGHLSLLPRLYHVVHVPPAVHQEAVNFGMARGSADAFQIRSAFDRGDLKLTPLPTSLPSSIAALPLGRGEQEAIFLAQSLPATVLCDDSLARSYAQSFGMAVRGTLGVLVAACRTGLIDLSDAENAIAVIKQRPDIWISRDLCDAVLAALRNHTS